jgi:hypothetical protein
MQTRKYIRCDFLKQAKWKLNFARVDALVVESLHTWLILSTYTINIHNIFNTNLESEIILDIFPMPREFVSSSKRTLH